MLIIIVVLVELAKVKLWNYYKILIWLKKMKHFKKLNIKNNFEAINLLKILIKKKKTENYQLKILKMFLKVYKKWKKQI